MQITLATQIASSLGALLILIAYIGHQFHWMDSGRPPYNILNAVGSGILAWLAFRPFQLGFFILETVWALVSIYALTKSIQRSSPQAQA
jgi:hypothetical protein